MPKLFFWLEINILNQDRSIVNVIKKIRHDTINSWTKIRQLILCSELQKVVTASNAFPNDKILDLAKLKAFADDKLNIAKNDDSSLW